MICWGRTAGRRGSADQARAAGRGVTGASRCGIPPGTRSVTRPGRPALRPLAAESGGIASGSASFSPPGSAAPAAGTEPRALGLWTTDSAQTPAEGGPSATPRPPPLPPLAWLEVEKPKGAAGAGGRRLTFAGTAGATLSDARTVRSRRRWPPAPWRPAQRAPVLQGPSAWRCRCSVGPSPVRPRASCVTADGPCPRRAVTSQHDVRAYAALAVLR